MIITVEQLAKKFGATTVFHDISFTMAERTIFTILGAKGAGKTTLLSCVAGIMKPSAGTIQCSGKIGYVSEKPLAQELLAPRQYIDAITALQDIQKEAAQEFLTEMFTHWGLIDGFDTPLVRSTRIVQFVTALSAALVGSPALLVVDEPDPDYMPLILATRGETTALLIGTNSLAVARHIGADTALLAKGVFQGLFTEETFDQLTTAYNAAVQG